MIGRLKNSGVGLIALKALVLILLFTSAQPGLLRAQATLSVDAPRVVEVGETFRLVFTANAQPSSFNPPSISGFDVLAGPSSSTMSSTQIVNGRRTESFQVSYTFILQARSEGKHTIPAASVIIDGKEIYSQPFSIEIVKATGTSSGEAKRDNSTTVSNNDIFIKLSVSKGRVMKGEPFIATIKLYTKVPVAGFEEVKFPTFNGFWSQEIETPQNIEFVRENIDGTIYNSALLRRYMLIPQQSGVITIDATEMTCQIQLRSSSTAPRSMFDDFFDSYQTVRKRVSSTPVRVVSEPLPPGAPQSFTGGVGEYKMDVRLSRDSVNANEAISLIVVIQGSGNINLIEAPKPQFPSGFEVYETKITDNSSRSTKGTSGSKQFEYPMIPRGPGVYKIPAVEFSYYDISQRRYVTLTSAAIELNVGRDRGGNTSGQFLSLGVNKQAVRSISDDIRYIKTGDPRLRSGSRFLFGSTLYFILLAMVAIIFFVAFKYLSKKIERRRDVARTRNRKADRVARHRLKNAGILLKQGLKSSFYEELNRALSGYISDKLNLTIADMSREKIETSLHEKGVNLEQTQELLHLLEQCDFARFAPESESPDMEKNYSRALKLISDMEL